MSRIIFSAAFLLGAAVIVWTAVGFVGNHALALTVTTLIGAVYLLGAFELLQFRRATVSLTTALSALTSAPFSLNGWYEKLHASLQNPVRLRIEGERVGLPGPVLAPYLIGLLVMLGMLGTFLGMVVTLNGAVFALEGNPDLEAIRSGLAAPIRGLGLAFGTSVAGVAASAMLGLLSTLARRERLLAGQLLDSKIATVLRDFSLVHHRQETFKAMQQQAQALPGVVDKLEAMALQMERMGQQLSETLVANQERFHSATADNYKELAGSVAISLNTSLADSGRVVGECIKPIIADAMSGMAKEARDMHEAIIQVAQAQLNGLADRFSESANEVAGNWRAALTAQQQSNQTLVGELTSALQGFNSQFEKTSVALQSTFNEAATALISTQAEADKTRLTQWAGAMENVATTLKSEWQNSAAQVISQQEKVCTSLESAAKGITDDAQARSSEMLSEMKRLLTSSEELVRSRVASEEAWLEAQGERIAQLAVSLRAELSALRDEESARGKLAVEQLGSLQAAVATHLSTLGAALEEPMTRLIHTASEAPRAAAEVIGELRQQISNNIKQDNGLLEERSRLMQQLDTLLSSMNQTATEQRTAIEQLVQASANMLNKVEREFTAQVGSETEKLTATVAEVSGSAIEVSSLSEAFSFAVQLFTESNEKLVENLARVEAALERSAARSDEQLGYYVAQAREIIDLSLLSQREVFDEMRQLNAKKEAVAAEVS